jgi:TM2 domain-containing membrane protein YozV
MYCRHCGAEVDEAAVVCVTCGVPPRKGKKFCQNCRAETVEEQVLCVKCGAKLASAGTVGIGVEGVSKRIIAAILALLVGSLGIHKFFTGYTKEGVIMIVVTVLGSMLFGLGPLAMWIIAIIEGINYLKMSDDEFEATYIQGRKGWL